MTIDQEELDGYEITDFDESDYQEYWIEQMERSDWSAAQFLAKLLRENTFCETCGKKSKLFLLTDGESLISFCTFAEKDDIPDTELTPWIGFVYTFEEYRHNGCMRKLISFVEEYAKKNKVRKLYISTDQDNLYEHFGYKFLTVLKDIRGNNSKIYVKRIRRFF